MFTNRFSQIVLVLVVVAIAMLTVSMAASPKTAIQPYQDYAQRHAGANSLPAVKLADSLLGSDYFQRHPELIQTVNAVDTSDFYLRHTEWQSASQAIDTSDYYLRHPELSGR